jgi:adenine-specific DNA-methyltransferase
MIKYIGSKRALMTSLLTVIDAIQPNGSVIDLFSGTSRVGHGLKNKDYRVLANDHNAYAETIARCYVAADREDHEHEAEMLIREFNSMPGKAGYFTDVFCEQSRFFQPKNGERVDAIREELERKGLPPELRAVLLVSLMEAADRVDSTTGVQMAYLKQWAPRASNDLELRLPDLLPRAQSGKGESFCLDALTAVEKLEADICYFDPPYNQHKYLGNYHIWESLVLWDKPEVYGIACKRVDCRERGSDFNSKPASRNAMKKVIQNARAEHLVVSFNNEGYFTRADIEEMLSSRGKVILFAHDFKRYVGAQIGIHNLKGQKVGEVSHLRNIEYIYVATHDESVIERLRSIGGQFSHEMPAESVPVPKAKSVRPDKESLSPQNQHE